MKTTRRRFLLPFALALFLGMLFTAGAEELNLDFTLLNKTGYTIKKIYIGPTSSEDWGDNLLKGSLEDGESVQVTFSPKANAKKWDIKVIYEDKDTAQWLDLKLTEITKVTLHWDATNQKSTAKIE